MRISFTLQGDVTGDELRTLLEVLGTMARIALLVVREDLGLSDRASAVLAELDPFLVRKSRGSCWPGTALIGDDALLLEYEFNTPCRLALLRYSNGLFSWQQPASPEDLCLLRSDGSVLMGTVAHERDAFFELTDAEAAVLWDAMPNLPARLIAAAADI